MTFTVTRTRRTTTRSADVNGLRITAENLGGHYAVYAHLRPGHAPSGPSYRSLGTVPGGRGVNARIAARVTKALTAGQVAHDTARCRACTH